MKIDIRIRDHKINNTYLLLLAIFNKNNVIFRYLFRQKVAYTRIYQNYEPKWSTTSVGSNVRDKLMIL